MFMLRMPCADQKGCPYASWLNVITLYLGTRSFMKWLYESLYVINNVNGPVEPIKLTLPDVCFFV